VSLLEEKPEAGEARAGRGALKKQRPATAKRHCTRAKRGAWPRHWTPRSGCTAHGSPTEAGDWPIRERVTLPLYCKVRLLLDKSPENPHTSATSAGQRAVRTQQAKRQCGWSLADVKSTRQQKV
jgi:hypothetical protein